MFNYALRRKETGRGLAEQQRGGSAKSLPVSL